MITTIIIIVLAVILVLTILFNRLMTHALRNCDNDLAVATEIITHYINLTIEYYGAETAKNILENSIKAIGNSADFDLGLPAKELTEILFAQFISRNNDNNSGE